jgi:hypothetical protein
VIFVISQGRSLIHDHPIEKVAQPMSADRPESGPKKLLENPVLGGLMVPIAIVLVGALIIFGVTKMLSTERSYKDLVREMQSKTFGNRWVAAFELSKILSSSAIPEEDLPWLVENLFSTYRDAQDSRTRDFIVVALGSLKSELALAPLVAALSDEDSNVKFHALVAIGNGPVPAIFNWAPVEKFLTDKDYALRQASALVIAQHQGATAAAKLYPLLNDDEPTVRYSTALALSAQRDEKSLPLLREILVMGASEQGGGLDPNQLAGLKLNLLETLKKTKWDALSNEIAGQIEREVDPRVANRMREILILLKN